MSAFLLADVQPVFVTPRPGTDSNLPGVVTPDDIERAIYRNPDAKAVFVTYPNYYGLCADLETICAMAHEAGMRMIVDGAHSAAFDFSGELPLSPAQCGCDLWAVSLHKTLPAMNQCAALCVGRECNISLSYLQSRLNWIQTTSPSYVLLASSEHATARMREEGAVLLSRLVALVQDTIWRIGQIGGYKVVSSSIPYDTGAYDRDILRLVIDVSERGLTGIAAAKDLLRRGVAVEGADLSNIILICTVSDTKEDYDALVRALADVRGGIYSIEDTFTNADVQSMYSGEFAYPLKKAVQAPREAVPVAKSVGRIAAVSAGLYPPGVPLVLPGQKITQGQAMVLERMRRRGYGTFGYSDTIDIAKVDR